MTTTMRALFAIASGAFSSLVGLLFTIVGGVAAWTVFRGIPGVMMAMIVGGLTAFAIRRFTSLPASPIAGAIGAMVAAYLAIASAEVVSPGSFDWAVKGGLYGAMVGAPIGAALGPLALFETARKKSESPRMSNRNVH